MRRVHLLYKVKATFERQPVRSNDVPSLRSIDFILFLASCCRLGHPLLLRLINKLRSRDIYQTCGSQRSASSLSMNFQRKRDLGGQKYGHTRSPKGFSHEHRCRVGEERAKREEGRNMMSEIRKKERALWTARNSVNRFSCVSRDVLSFD